MLCLFPSLFFLRSFQSSWGKSTEARFCLTVRASFRLRVSSVKSNRARGTQAMVRSWVGLSLDQLAKLEELGNATGKSRSGMIREAVSSFLLRRQYQAGATIPGLPSAPGHGCKSVTVYLPPLHWDSLREISRGTRRHRGHPGQRGCG